MNSISDIKHAFYINLLSRPDRKDHVEEQLKTIGIKPERFNAIRMDNGAIGCSMSHLRLLEIAKLNNWEHILIVEDDILFTDPNLFVTQFNKLYISITDVDVDSYDNFQYTCLDKQTAIKLSKELRKQIALMD